MAIREHKARDGRQGFVVDVSRVIDGELIRRTRYVYGWSKRDVDRLEDRLRAELREIELGGTANGGKRGGRRATVGEIVERYLAYSKVAHRGPQAHVEQSKAILRYFDAGNAAASITHDDVIQFMAWRRAQTTPWGTPITPSTVDKEVAMLGRVYRHAFVNGILDPAQTRNPCEYVRLARVPVRRERILTQDELLRLLQVLSPLHRAIVMLARFTGLRKHHILELKWGQIRDGIIRPPDFDPRKALYLSTKRFGMPPIHRGLVDIIPKPHTDPMWEWRGKPLAEFAHAFRAGCKIAAVEAVTFHDFRRTYITSIHALGVSPLVAQIVCGHAMPRELDIHSRYRVVEPSEIARVGELVFASPEYQEALALCRTLAKQPFSRFFRHRMGFKSDPATAGSSSPARTRRRRSRKWGSRRPEPT